MARTLLVLACLVIASPAFAGPIAVDFTLGHGYYGSYHFAPDTPGERRMLPLSPEEEAEEYDADTVAWLTTAGMDYANAISAFSLFYDGQLLASGSSGDIYAQVDRTIYADSIYQVVLRVDGGDTMGLFAYSQVVYFLPDETIQVSLPNIAAELPVWGDRTPGVQREAPSTEAWYTDIEDGYTTNLGGITSLSTRPEAVSSLRAAPTSVPEPATWLLSTIGLGLMALRRRLQ